MKSLRLAFLLLAVLATAQVLPVTAGELTAEDVFGKLKAMEGSWRAEAAEALEGEAGGEEPTEPGTHDFRASANGTVVMEVMSPGTPHEMINMYHMDGEDLVLTHYCAGGNQPIMRLDRKGLADGRIEFDFVGGTNLDPAVDMHIHSTTFEFGEDGSMASTWVGWAGGEPSGVMQIQLSRVE